MDLGLAPAHEIAQAVRSGAVAASEILEHFLSKIESAEPLVNAWRVVDADGARAQAASIDAAVSRGEDPGPLAGVPVGVKDVDDLAGEVTTFGSLLHAGDAPAPTDSTHVARLRRAGCMLVGKTTTAEFGAGSFTSTVLTGVTRNPWDPRRTPGGSSGGSSAAVAAAEVALATGGDGGGSIRIPAAYTGVVGFKPTMGRIPLGPRNRDWTRTVARGPLARTVRDAARYTDAASGPDPFDLSSYHAPVCLENAIGSSLEGLRVMWTDSMGYGRSEPAVAAVARAAADRLIEASGLHEVDVALAWADPAVPWLVLNGVNLAAELGDHRPDPDSRAKMTPGNQMVVAALDHVSVDQVAWAITARDEFETRTADLFERIDLLLTPTTATTAFGAEGPMPTEVDGVAGGALCGIPFTYPFNVTGNPAISVPAGFVDAMPVGLQIVGRYAADADVIAAAAALESVSDPWRPAPL